VLRQTRAWVMRHVGRDCVAVCCSVLHCVAVCCKHDMHAHTNTHTHELYHLIFTMFAIAFSRTLSSFFHELSHLTRDYTSADDTASILSFSRTFSSQCTNSVPYITTTPSSKYLLNITNSIISVHELYHISARTLSYQCTNSIISEHELYHISARTLSSKYHTLYSRTGDYASADDTASLISFSRTLSSQCTNSIIPLSHIVFYSNAIATLFSTNFRSSHGTTPPPTTLPLSSHFHQLSHLKSTKSTISPAISHLHPMEWVEVGLWCDSDDGRVRALRW